MYKRLILLISSIFLFASCESDPLQADISEVERETRFRRFDRAFFNLDTLQFESALQKLNEDFSPFLMGGNTLENWQYQRKDEQQLQLFRDSEAIFGDMQAWDQELNSAMKHFYYHFPQAPTITYYSYISNLDFSYPILFADTLCFAALDLYLGADAPYYGMMPRYLAYYRQPRFLVRDCMEGLAQNYVPGSSSEKSLLEWMLYYGRQMYFLEAMMPEKPESVIIKYTEEQLEFCRQNERNIWAYFIENNLLFRSGTELEKRFIDPAPFSKFGTRMDNESPGRIGQWVGWQIVRSFARENPQYSLEEIMALTDARKLLRDSGYKPA